MEQAVTFPLVTIHYMYIYAYILKDRRLHHSGVVVIGIEAVFTYIIFTITFFTASVIRLLTIISDSPRTVVWSQPLESSTQKQNALFSMCAGRSKFVHCNTAKR